MNNAATDFTYKGKKFLLENKGAYVLLTAPSGFKCSIKTPEEFGSWSDSSFRYKLRKAYTRIQ